MPRYPGFVGPSYTAYSGNLDIQQSMNLYPEADESGAGKNIAALIMRPGLTAPYTTLATAPVRALYAGGDPVQGPERMFAVGGSKLIEIASGGGLTVRGDVGDDAAHTPAILLPNGNQLGVVSAGKFYCDNGAGPVQPAMGNNTGTCTVFNFVGTGYVLWTSGAKFAASMAVLTLGGVGYTVTAFVSDIWVTIATAPATGNYAFSFPQNVTAFTGTFLDGYFIVVQPSSKTFQISALFDGTSWDALDYGVKEGYADNIAAIWADHGQLWLFGTDSIEVHEDTGNNNFPFQLIPGSFMNHGLRAPDSVARLGSYGLAWIGGDQRGILGAFIANAFTPTRISTHAVEKAWEGYATINDAIAYPQFWRGHMLYSIHFPTADKTWVYDAGLNAWHERGWWNGSANGRERGRCHAYAFGKHLVGDYSTGAVYQQSDTQYSDNGTAIHWNRTGPYAPNPIPVAVGHAAVPEMYQFFREFTLDMETGQGNSPTITMKWTNDGGHNWQVPLTASAGASGATTTRVVWRRLGKTQRPYLRAFDVSGSDASKTVLIDASYE